MHYYQHNIPDFNNATRHLTRVERSLYRDLIELYYDTEQPLPADDFDRLARRVLAFSDDEKTALRFVLDEFFSLEDGAYRQKRCDLEIEKYHNNNSAKAKAGKASAEARRKKAKAENNSSSTPVQQPLNECATNQEPGTSNQEPEIKHSKSGKKFSDDDFAIACEFWESLFDENPENKKPKLDSWADVIRLMRERDRRNAVQIRWLWRWARADTFWSTNIRSPDKLRKHFDALVDKVKKQQSERRHARPTNQPQFENDSLDWAKDLIDEGDGGGWSPGQPTLRAVAGDFPGVATCVRDGSEGLPGDQAPVDARFYRAGH